MRFVLNSFPVPTPLKPQVRSKNTDRFILGRRVEISASFKHANVEGNSKIVVGVTTTRISHDAAWFRSSLRVEIVLLIVGTKATEYFDDDAAGSGFCDECTRVWLHLWEERRNNSLTTIIHLIARWLWWLRVWTNAIVNRLPRLGTRLSVGIDAKCCLNCANNLVEIHNSDLHRLAAFARKISGGTNSEMYGPKTLDSLVS